MSTLYQTPQGLQYQAVSHSLFLKISGVFSSDFINSEINQAENIKDKQNKKTVIHLLKMIKSRIKIYPKNESGYIILCGLDNNSKEIFECIEPMIPINSFYYECSRTFNMDVVKKLFIEKSSGNVIFISGIECIIYDYIGYWKKIKSINANLIKRHSKGGQSSIRFARLAEESRLHYVTYCIDYINDLCNPLNSFIFGSTELKTKLLDHQTLKINLKTSDKFHEFNQTTIYDKYFENLINDNIKINNDKIYEEIIECIDLNPDILVFSEDELKDNIDNTEYILVINNKLLDYYTDIYKDKKIINLDICNRYYARLKDFVIIGKMYYVN